MDAPVDPCLLPTRTVPATPALLQLAHCPVAVMPAAPNRWLRVCGTHMYIGFGVWGVY